MHGIGLFSIVFFICSVEDTNLDCTAPVSVQSSISQVCLSKFEVLYNRTYAASLVRGNHKIVFKKHSILLRDFKSDLSVCDK